MKPLIAARWNILRLLIAAALLWFVAADTGSRLAKLRLQSAANFDFPAEIRTLRAAGRYGEAIMVAQNGEALARPRAEEGDEAAVKLLERIRTERDLTAAEQNSLLRRVRDLGMGVLSGQGTSLESLVGAVAADFFVVGDVRDLLIQTGKLAVDGEADELIVLLSAAGLVTTLAPEIDWAPSLLKVARKSGAMTRRMGDWLTGAVRAGKKEELVKVMEDVASLSKSASPGGAVRLLRMAEEPADIARMARFAEKNSAAAGQVSGAFALHALGDQATDTLKAAEATADAAKAEKAVLAAAEKGPAGATWLRQGAWRAAMQPHPILGIIKGIYKGNVGALMQRVLDFLGPHAWWLIPLLAAWTFIEGVLLIRRFSTPTVPTHVPAPA